MRLLIRLCALLLLLFTTACAGLAPVQRTDQPVSQAVSAESEGSLLSHFVPVFVVEEAGKSYNRIGTPGFKPGKAGEVTAYVDSNRPTIYAQQQEFSSNGNTYLNLIYRIHFEATPSNHLTAGNNVGLLTIITLDADNTPLLLTTAHTCGCYLAVIPTSALPRTAYPENWPTDQQQIYGEQLPVRIDLKPATSQSKFVLHLRDATHRVMAVELRPVDSDSLETAPLVPMQALRELPSNGQTLSFFETEGPRKGYVRDNHKPYERWLMGWWALDWRIGEDKDLGPRETTGTVFYTSLKPWARSKSDLWRFADFLRYWGWAL